MYMDQRSPFVPVVPDAVIENEVVIPLYGHPSLGQDEESPEAAAEAAREESARKALKFGLAGVAIGATLTAGMTALALSSYKRSGSVMGPALVAGLGSAAIGSSMVFLLSRVSAGKQTDPRLAALAIGARMAV